MAEQELPMNENKRKPMSQWARELAAASRKSMRICALEYRRCRARGWQAESDRWLIFARYHRAASVEWLTGESAISPQLARAADQMIKELAATYPED